MHDTDQTIVGWSWKRLTHQEVTMHEVGYIQNQVYLNPHPKELMLRNYV